MKIVNFLEEDCILQFGKYGNGRTAIQLVSNDEMKELIATATVNIVDARCDADEVIIKDYSENDGMLAALVYAGVVSNPVRYAGSGYVSCPVCKLLIKPE